MTQASYNDIAQWYDQFLRERPVYTEVLLPNLLALVGEVKGEVICDLACGQGWVARELARRGAQVTGFDLAPNLLALARGYEEQEPLGIVYVQGDAQRAEQLGDSQFTGCVCVMALINIPASRSAQWLLSHFAHGKPVMITEVGLCAYQGAEDKGARGFMIVDQPTDCATRSSNPVGEEGITRSDHGNVLSP